MTKLLFLNRFKENFTEISRTDDAYINQLKKQIAELEDKINEVQCKVEIAPRYSQLLFS